MSENLKNSDTIGFWRKWGTERLSASSSSTPALDSILLLAFTLETTKDKIFSHEADIIPAETVSVFKKFVERRLTGEPVAYIIGQKAFWKHDFYVTPAVLIPKPDTEMLVEKAVEILRQKTAEKPLFIADVCTGSGCIAVSMYSELMRFLPATESNFQFFATDICDNALQVAKTNASSILGTEHQIKFLKGNLLEPLLQTGLQFDLIMSNPPYVPSELVKELLKDGRREPELALDGGNDGLQLIRQMIPQVWKALAKNGILLIETGEYNAAETRELLQQQGFANVSTYTDIGGQPRLTKAEKP